MKTINKNLLAHIFYLPVKCHKLHAVRRDKGFSTKQIEALKVKHASVISDVSDERETGDGVWFYLKAGYCWDGEVHCVHEWTGKDAARAFGFVRPCKCADCLAELKTISLPIA